MLLSNWGNYPSIEANVRSFAYLPQLEDIRRTIPAFIPRGLGRCYGDSALAREVVSTTSYDRFLAFDGRAGVLECHAGTSLADIVGFIVPRGWFLPVTPGTKFVTVGGAVAADVHGKNHHLEGSFSRHVEELRVMLASGEVIRCSHADEPELFAATCGGMGLTGVILSARIRLKKIETAWIKQTTAKARTIYEVMDLFEQNAAVTYSVAWIDCLSKGNSLGRSILVTGEHARRDDPQSGRYALSIPPKKTFSVPFFFPSCALGGASARLFNAMYYAKGQAGTRMVDYDSFFYPLDSVLSWNRIYGRRGFCQYQFVLPMDQCREGIPKILKKIAALGEGSFLAVLKMLGNDAHLISFPMSGYTLALDFPMTKTLFLILAELDRLVLEYGGRLYLAKDARMDRIMFERGYAKLAAFKAIKEKVDPHRKFRSIQSERLGL